MKNFYNFLKALIKVQQWWKLLIIAVMFMFGISAILYILLFGGLKTVISVLQYINSEEVIVKSDNTRVE